MRLLARATEVFGRLKPYRLQALAQYQASGLPVMRHPYLHYEGDPRLHRLRYQYLLGRDLLVAPGDGTAGLPAGLLPGRFPFSTGLREPAGAVGPAQFARALSPPSRPPGLRY